MLKSICVCIIVHQCIMTSGFDIYFIISCLKKSRWNLDIWNPQVSDIQSNFNILTKWLGNSWILCVMVISAVFKNPWWRHDMKTRFALLVFCEGNPTISAVSKSSHVQLWYCLYCLPDQSVEQTVEHLLNTMTLMWRHCHVEQWRSTTPDDCSIVI